MQPLVGGSSGYSASRHSVNINIYSEAGLSSLPDSLMILNEWHRGTLCSFFPHLLLWSIFVTGDVKWFESLASVKLQSSYVVNCSFIMQAFKKMHSINMLTQCFIFRCND